MKWIKDFFCRRRLLKDIRAKLEALKKARPELEREIDLLLGSFNCGVKFNTHIAKLFLKAMERLGRDELQGFEFFQTGLQIWVSEDGNVTVKKTTLVETENSLTEDEKETGRQICRFSARGLSLLGAQKRLLKKIKRAELLVESDKASLAKVIFTLMEINPGQDATAKPVGTEVHLVRTDGHSVNLALAEGNPLLRKQDFLQRRIDQLAELKARLELLHQLEIKNRQDFEECRVRIEAFLKEGKTGDSSVKLDREKGIKTFALKELEYDHIPAEDKKKLQTILGNGTFLLPIWVVKALGLEASLEPNSSVAKQFDKDMLPPEMVETPAPAPTPEQNPTPPKGGLHKKMDEDMRP